MIRNASAQWQGGLKDGSGTVSTGSAVINRVPYSFSKRFESEPGTNPEELIGAAYAGCYAMALSANAEKAGHKPTEVTATANLTFEKTDAGFTVTAIHLAATAKIPGISPEELSKLAEATKSGCPIGRLLAPGTRLSVEVKLV